MFLYPHFSLLGGRGDTPRNAPSKTTPRHRRTGLQTLSPSSCRSPCR